MRAYPKEEKIFLISSKAARKAKGLEEARNVLERGIKYNPSSFVLWQQAIFQEIESQNFARARPLIEKARKKLPKSSQLWLLEIKLE